MCKSVVCAQLERNPVPVRGPGWCRWQCVCRGPDVLARQDLLPPTALLQDGGRRDSKRWEGDILFWVLGSMVSRSQNSSLASSVTSAVLGRGLHLSGRGFAEHVVAVMEGTSAPPKASPPEAAAKLVVTDQVIES